MNLYGPDFYTDDALVAEIRAYAGARRELATRDVAVIAGEGRRLEFTNTADQKRGLDADLREMLAEARRRGLSIGGNGGHALAVEIG